MRLATRFSTPSEDTSSVLADVFMRVLSLFIHPPAPAGKAQGDDRGVRHGLQLRSLEAATQAEAPTRSRESFSDLRLRERRVGDAAYRGGRRETRPPSPSAFAKATADKRLRLAGKAQGDRRGGRRTPHLNPLPQGRGELAGAVKRPTGAGGGKPGLLRQGYGGQAGRSRRTIRRGETRRQSPERDSG